MEMGQVTGTEAPWSPASNTAAAQTVLQTILASDSPSVQERRGQRRFQEFRLPLEIPKNSVCTLPAANPDNNSPSKQRNQGGYEHPLPYPTICSRAFCFRGCRRCQHTRSAAQRPSSRDSDQPAIRLFPPQYVRAGSSRTARPARRRLICMDTPHEESAEPPPPPSRQCNLHGPASPRGSAIYMAPPPFAAGPAPAGPAGRASPRPHRPLGEGPTPGLVPAATASGTRARPHQPKAEVC